MKRHEFGRQAQYQGEDDYDSYGYTSTYVGEDDEEDSYEDSDSALCVCLDASLMELDLFH